MEMEPVAMLRSHDVVITGQSVKNEKIDEVSNKITLSTEKRLPLFFDGATKNNYIAVLVRSWKRLSKHRPRVTEAAAKNRDRVAVLYARDILSIQKGLLLNSIVITARIGTKRGSSGNLETQVKDGSLKFSSFKDALRWRATLLRLSATEDKNDDSCLIVIPPDLARTDNIGESNCASGVNITNSGEQLTYAQQIGYWLGSDNNASNSLSEEFDIEDTSSSDEGGHNKRLDSGEPKLNSSFLQSVLKAKQRKSRKKFDDWTSSTSFSSSDFNTYDSSRLHKTFITFTPNKITKQSGTHARCDVSRTNPREIVCINARHFWVLSRHVRVNPQMAKPSHVIFTSCRKVCIQIYLDILRQEMRERVCEMKTWHCFVRTKSPFRTHFSVTAFGVCLMDTEIGMSLWLRLVFLRLHFVSVFRMLNMRRR